MEIHVVCVPDGKFWFGQGVELDYAAAGTTIDELKDNFVRGFKATTDVHLEEYGKLSIRQTPAESLAELGVSPTGEPLGDALSRQGGFVWIAQVGAPVRVIVTLREGHRDRETVHRIVTRAHLYNLNESRTEFFDYRLFSADATEEGITMLEGMPEVSSVTLPTSRGLDIPVPPAVVEAVPEGALRRLWRRAWRLFSL
jgi:muconolactone delta-isomerase